MPYHNIVEEVKADSLKAYTTPHNSNVKHDQSLEND